LLTLKKLFRGENKYWTKRPLGTRSSIETLAWGAARELAMMIEMHIEDPGQLQRDWPDMWLVLMGIDEYLKDIKVLPSQPHAAVMLMIERTTHCLRSRGDET
jgi:hypothetical protein